MTSWVGLSVGGDVVDCCSSFLFGCGSVSLLSCMSSDMKCVTSVGMVKMEKPGVRFTFY